MCTCFSETEFELKKRRLGNVLPRDEDLHGSAQALIRLQDTYEIDIRNLAKGDIGGGLDQATTAAKLTAQVRLTHIFSFVLCIYRYSNVLIRIINI